MPLIRARRKDNVYHLKTYCNCDNADRCFNPQGLLSSILCRLKHKKEETIAMWARRVEAKKSGKED